MHGTRKTKEFKFDREQTQKLTQVHPELRLSFSAASKKNTHNYLRS